MNSLCVHAHIRLYLHTHKFTHILVHTYIFKGLAGFFLSFLLFYYSVVNGNTICIHLYINRYSCVRLVCLCVCTDVYMLNVNWRIQLQIYFQEHLLAWMCVRINLTLQLLSSFNCCFYWFCCCLNMKREEIEASLTREKFIHSWIAFYSHFPSFLCLSLLSGCILFHWIWWSPVKMLLGFLIHINGLNRIEINLPS